MNNKYIMEFPTIADFDSKNKVTRQLAIKWKEVPTGVYKIVDFSIINTKYGKSMILTLENEDGNDIRCWAPSSIMEDHKLSEYTFIYVYDEENNFRPYNFM